MTTLKQSHDALLAALKKTEWAEWNDSDFGTQIFCTECRQEKTQGHWHTCAVGEALKAQPEETCEWRIDECHYRRSSCDGSMRTARVEVDKFCPGCGKRIEVKQ